MSTNASQFLWSLFPVGRDWCANKAYIETVPVEVTNGKFTITFTSNVENPQINAIELVPQS